MIWNSIFVMTLMDLAIAGMAVAMLVTAMKKGLLGNRSPAALCLASGILFIGLFYMADLLVMHIGPALMGRAEAMQLMEYLHLNIAWPVTLIFVALLFASLLKFVGERSYSERQIGLISDSLPIAIIYVDSDERYRFVNPLYEKWYGITREELLGQRIRDVVSGEAYSALAPHIKDALSGSEVGFNGVLSFPNPPITRDIQSRLVPDRDDRDGIKGFYALISDVTEQNELERQVVAVSERERNLIGRELHDNLGQALTGTSLKLEALARRLQRKDSEDLHTVNELAEITRRSIQDTRQLARLLAPVFDSGSLDTALRSLATQAAKLFGIECTVDCDATELVLNEEAITHIYRIAQESVTNAVRHGRAKNVRIVCQTVGSRFRIEILDDGTGIEASPSHEATGIGINTMRYRSRMIGGDLRVEPVDGSGTRVVCSCPVSGLGTRAVPPAAQVDEERSEDSVDKQAVAAK